METDTDTFPAYIPIDPRSPYPDFRPGAVWTQAKADYLAGESAPRVCERYELALSTFRTRMRVEGWRRCDQIEDDVEPRELEAAPPTPELVDLAWRAMADALKRGRVYEARAFMRLVHDLRAEVSREEAIVQHQAWKAAQAETLDPALHDLHAGSNSAAPSLPAHPRGSGDPDLNPSRSCQNLGPRLRGDERGGEREGSAGGVPPGSHPETVQPAEPAGDRPQGPALGRGMRVANGPDTATTDPALHGLHSGLDSASPSADIDAVEADLAPVRAEAERLQALARSGKASKAELLTLHTLRTTLRQHRTVCDTLRNVDRAMSG